MDYIKAGLDFGTHQTKICVQRRPNEGHGEPIYEFFTFADSYGRKQYFLPSIVQINDDDTLSYGFVDQSREKFKFERPTRLSVSTNERELPIEEHALCLYDIYATEKNTLDDLDVLRKMLNLRKQRIGQERVRQNQENELLYQEQLAEYHENRYLFRYFKQATFSEREWNKELSSDFLCLCYITYVIFLLEEKYGDSFGINMGIPSDDKDYRKKKYLAVRILLTAFHLVENVYKKDIKLFLAEKVSDLKGKAQLQDYSDEKKVDYRINVFPEAYASLISLTSKGKITPGMSLTADIGGGTTDISFFTLNGDKPRIYKYWSIPRGLNYIAEKSGFDYAEGNFKGKVNKEVLDKYNRKKKEIIYLFVKELVSMLIQETNIPSQNFYEALRNRVLVYTGGGSMYSFITGPIDDFSDIMVIDTSLWREEHIVDKANVNRLCKILTTAYGLSQCENDSDDILSHHSTLFDGFKGKEPTVKKEFVDKDKC